MLAPTLLTSILMAFPVVFGIVLRQSENGITKRQTSTYYLGCYTYSVFDGEAVESTVTANSGESCMARFTTAPVVFTAGTTCFEATPSVTAYNLTHGQVADSFCSLACPGNAAETCGDGSIDQNTYLSAYGSTPPGWSGLGCYKDVSGGALRDYSTTNHFHMTQETCESTCRNDGYIFAAVESGDKCTCGNTLYATQTAPSRDCNTRCTGSRSETCGGRNYLNIFEFN